MALAVMLLHYAVGRAEVLIKDNYQQNYGFSKIKTVVILAFMENYRNERGTIVNLSITKILLLLPDIIQTFYP